MHAHCIQHVPFEGLGCMADQLRERGCSVSYTAMYDNPLLPDPDMDLLIVMGGPMSVNDEQELPWLVEEKIFIRRYLAARRPMLGVCLGAQLMASALGAAVYRNPEREIGWLPITDLAEDAGLFRFGQDMVFHWHGETFDLPPGAVRLAQSRGCANQAFQLGTNAVGLQFHLEATPATVAGMLAACGHELTGGAYVQNAEEIMRLTAQHAAAANVLSARLLDFLLTAPRG